MRGLMYPCLADTLTLLMQSLGILENAVLASVLGGQRNALTKFPSIRVQFGDCRVLLNHTNDQV